MNLAELRNEYHRRICESIVRVQTNREGKEYLNFADGSNRSSIEIAQHIVCIMGWPMSKGTLPEQTAGNLFEQITKDYLHDAFQLLHHMRPGRWCYKIGSPISSYVQYAHLARLEGIVKTSSELASALGSQYVVTPDIVMGRYPASDDEINSESQVIDASLDIARLTPLRESNTQGEPRLLLHACISCKWTVRSDRAQNTRTEAISLIRHRKGHLPHIVAVTAEPLPMRIAALALGTGDLDCVYHFALPELQTAVDSVNNEDQKEMLDMLVHGHRLRDISDLPFDLAV